MSTKFTSPRPYPDDGWATDTSKSQAETEKVLTALFQVATEKDGLLTLNRNVHLNWLVRLLFQGFPQKYVSQDASQPWLLYFVLQSFQALGVAFDPDTKKKAISTIMAKQHHEGGFGGGPGQLPHILPTYASVCALAIVGHKGEGGGWDLIDRAGMYRFFMSMKQPDGSFIVNRNAEVDVRGIYCLLVCATLLDLLTPDLVHNTFDFVRSCQTYEGGFSAASQPYFSPESEIITAIRPSLGEAHGGYTSCAVASLILLKPMTAPLQYPGINGSSLLRWAAMLQGSEFSEGGGFRGRTNKLVDGCYSWWVGGLFTLIEEITGESTGESIHEKREHEAVPHGDPPANDNEWMDDDDFLFDRHALQQYIYLAAQSKTGGLRDKPTTPADAYHTLYNLSGLASAQHRTYLAIKNIETVRSNWKNSEGFISGPSNRIPHTEETDQERQIRRREVFVAAHSWQEDEKSSQYVGGKLNRVNAVHPLFNLTITATRAMLDHFYGQTSI